LQPGVLVKRPSFGCVPPLQLSAATPGCVVRNSFSAAKLSDVVGSCCYDLPRKGSAEELSARGTAELKLNASSL